MCATREGVVPSIMRWVDEESLTPASTEVRRHNPLEQRERNSQYFCKRSLKGKTF
jgi:hypothetical protein